MRGRFIALSLALACATTAAPAQVSVGVHIGVNVPAYPQLVVVPGYPVYYAPSLPANYFFYDGLYWVLEGDRWYASSWYNGPWRIVEPERVPYFVLRVPVRYYRAPPPFFHGWAPAAPPRWGEHWGVQWQQRHRDWDRWDRAAMPAPAPLPVYQRQYSGDRYPAPDRQPQLQQRNYHYQPRSEVARQHIEPAAPGQDDERKRGAKDERPQPVERPGPPRKEERHEAPRAERGHPAPQERLRIERQRAEPSGREERPTPGREQPRGRDEAQERGHGKGEGRDKRDEGSPGR